MIDNIIINNFKCFFEKNLELSEITLLTGINCGGKSTVIQALLLLIQNITNNGTSPLNGHFVSVGTFSEARNVITNARDFEIGAVHDGSELIMSFSEIDQICGMNLKSTNDYFNIFFNYNNHHIHYISANRIGAQDIYDKNLDKFDQFGKYGEYAIDYFEKNKTMKLDDELIIDNRSFTLGTQVNYWLKRILNTQITTEDIVGTDRVKAQYSYGINQRKFRPSNIGSGVSYIISIIVTCLSASKNDIIILENPEIHLHPKAQSILTDFFVFIANYGIQLIIESHSDHIFNGIRKNIFRKNISLEKVKVHFFNIKDDLSEPVKIILNNNGQILNHQIGLFDQFDDDLDELLGL